MAKRWSTKASKEVESPEVEAFLKDIDEVSKKHGLSISHEDGHGAFIVERRDEFHIRWLNDAHIGGTV